MGGINGIWWGGWVREGDLLKWFRELVRRRSEVSGWGKWVSDGDGD